MLRQTPTIESPCKLICEIDITSAQCKGCGRTREEIAMWTRYSDVQRQFIMTELKERMGEFDDG
jgi:predicted Fe-S protein YdhL (DUF1289 family)